MIQDAPEFPYDLETLALITGINYSHLEMMYEGNMVPDHFHYERLARVLDEVQLEWMQRHDSIEPIYMKSRYGSVPDHYYLMNYIPASSILPNDLIAYRPIQPEWGNSWIRVIRLEHDDRMIRVETENTEITLPENQPVRVARPKGDIRDHVGDVGAGSSGGSPEE